MRRTTALRAAACAATLALAWPAAARASVFEMFGASPRSVALVGSLAATARGGEAAFHNPALLTASPVAGAWFGLTATGSDFEIRLQRPVCTQGYLACRSLHPAGFSSREPQVPSDSSGFALGWNYPLGGLFRDRVALGAGLALPAGHIIRISGPDPQTPNFVLYEGMPDRIAFLFAAAVRITDWWSVGIGTQVLAVLDARIDLRPDVTNHDMDHAAIRIGLEPRARLTAGTSLHPMPQLWLGVGYRQRLSLEYQIPTAIELGRPVAIDIDLGHETLFTPDMLQAGFGWRTADGRLLLAGTLALSLWSQAPDPSPQVALDAGGPVVRSLGLGELLDVGTDTPPIELHFANTWSPAAGAEWRAGEHLVLRGGYAYRPSPAPRASGPHNYLDNHAHAVGLGASWRFGALSAPLRERLQRTPADPGETPAAWHVDVGGQALWLPRRTVFKLDANDPVGPLSHGGTVWHGALAFGGAF